MAIKSTNKYSIITICNYDDYQNNEEPKGQQSGHLNGQQGANKGPTKGHIQEDKEGKELREYKELREEIDFLKKKLTKEEPNTLPIDYY